jgi:hypothetical protein
MLTFVSKESQIRRVIFVVLLLDDGQPVLHVLEGRVVGDVVGQDDALSAVNVLV